MAQLSISEHTADDDTVILDLSGNLLFDDGTEKLRCEVRRLISEGKKKINLNLENVSYVDSGGIGELISTLIAVNREDGELKLLNPTHKICTLLEMSNLMIIFDIVKDENSAVGN